MKELSQNTFKDTSKGTALILFEALWCPHCHAMHPILEEAEKEYPIAVYRVNVENEEALSARFSVRSVPTLVLLEGGREIARAFGFMRNLSQLLSEAGIQKSRLHV